MTSKKAKLRFQVPSCRNYFCEMERSENGYKLIFYQEGQKIRAFTITENQIDREYLRKMAVNVGINFYALTGPYDVADEILRQWHKYFEKKGFFSRFF